MILVLLGTQNNSFHRLLEKIQKCIDEGIIKEEVIVQAGNTKFESKNMQIFDIISAKKLKELEKEANFIITHGGVGSIVDCIKQNKKVIAVPRLHKYEEHVNDHQLQIIKTFDEQGYIKGIEKVEELDKAIKDIDSFEPVKFEASKGRIIEIISNFIEKRKILFAAYSLDVGGIETALLTLINYLAKTERYDITLALEKKEGIFLEKLDKNVKIITYTPSENKFILFRKIANLLKRIRFTLKYKNKFDFAVDFATYSLADSFVARTASKNNALWVHNNYLDFYERDIEKYKEFFNNIKVAEFKNIVFVSKFDKNNFEEYFPELKEKLRVFNNLIDYKSIIKKAKEQIDFEKYNEITFINVGRHDEKQKRLSRIIEAVEKLKKDNIKCKVLFVGDGPDKEKYEEMVKEKKLEEYIIFLGAQKNPYPYFNISDCLLLSSEYEGYPVVFVEAQILGLPIITTDISDSREDIENKYGIVTNKNTEEIYNAMKAFIEKGYKIQKEFSPEKYNQEILKELETIL